MTEVPSVALPNEMPKPVDITHLPAEILKSSAIEALMAQSDDLSARLRVNLRRLAILEDQLREALRQRQDLEERNRALEDSAAVAEQKYESIRFENSRLNENDEESQKELLHVRNLWLAERGDTIQQIENLKIETKEQTRKIHRLVRHRQKLHDVALRLRAEVRNLQTSHLELTSKLADSTERNQLLVERLHAQGCDFSQRLETLTNNYEQKLHGLQTTSDREIAESRFAFEQTLLELNAELQHQIAPLQESVEQLTQENKQLQEQCTAFHARFVHQVEIENKIQSLEKELRDSQAWREAAENKSKENSRLLRDLQSNEREIRQLKSDNEALHKQVENLQALWEQSRQSLEDLELREQALQKINQNLAADLQHARGQLAQPKYTEVLSHLDEQLTQILYSRHTQNRTTSPETTT